MLEEFKEYYSKARMMQELKFQGKNWTAQDVNDDLIWNVPIYDVVNRRYAAFSSLPEAIKASEDPKNNSLFFDKSRTKISDENFIRLCYLFRLCGSGINYKPKKKEESPFGTHGFGNFWIVKELNTGSVVCSDWIRVMPDSRFCDVKGYLLPMIKGGLHLFIHNKSEQLMNYLISYISAGKIKGIKQVVDYGNKWLIENGFKRQNFVLTAFAMDMAEYFPKLVDQNSDVYVGSNAKKCLKLIMPGVKNDEALRTLCEITGGYSKPYDMEDVACDFIRYLENFQSKEHIEMNNNVIYKNSLI
tara:strand:- start:209 stop:1111 length:903 start_codon:yes stop_codon:yes gene_type:complete